MKKIGIMLIIAGIGVLCIPAKESNNYNNYTEITCDYPEVKVNNQEVTELKKDKIEINEIEPEENKENDKLETIRSVFYNIFNNENISFNLNHMSIFLDNRGYSRDQPISNSYNITTFHPYLDEENYKEYSKKEGNMLNIERFYDDVLLKVCLKENLNSDEWGNIPLDRGLIRDISNIDRYVDKSDKWEFIRINGIKQDDGTVYVEVIELPQQEYFKMQENYKNYMNN